MELYDPYAAPEHLVELIEDGTNCDRKHDDFRTATDPIAIRRADIRRKYLDLLWRQAFAAGMAHKELTGTVKYMVVTQEQLDAFNAKEGLTS